MKQTDTPEGTEMPENQTPEGKNMPESTNTPESNQTPESRNTSGLFAKTHASLTDLNRFGYENLEAHLTIAFYREGQPFFSTRQIKELVEAGLILQTR
ncbi:hypothetical protein [Bythopirellula polymerisocia]|uniref:Uncharacterized protein n=1 Tax=Bythopirellula polymerisocia TaxID=2528003 RepID=A0A5C6CBX5_9BACT|nr:hypothetical protein [Bythopirellula polymerisocia]TWU20906.1 hypothetical protein Pla144_48070 [Bythopirellula polymerisocia]